jgi:4'-phosphopantetheinyl transferase
MSRRSKKVSNSFRPWVSRNRPALEGDQVHLWLVSLDVSGATVGKLQEVLAPDEQARAGRFHFEADRRRFTVARACLRKLLSFHLGIEATQVKFNYGDYGKLSLVEAINPQDLSFNLAHSGEFALYGLTRKRQIGVDLERIQPELSIDEIARRHFSAGEVDQLGRLPASVRHRAFFNCWTRKEAFIKAIGIGLSLPLDQFDVTLALDEPAVLVQTRWDQEEALRWSLAAFDAGRDYVAAVAVEGHDWFLRAWQLSDCVLL